ncbi:MAG: hypothetical protein H6708_29515 [Kofleriaceae bacterium]|nr:hypothetical protein [Myxococcales bacterium]MCB9564543.1 hypothetical protein [Kofleriaceae bacterium]
MSRAPWLIAFASLAASAALGCGDNLGVEADLAGADAAHLRRAVGAASGGDALAAYALAAPLAGLDAPTACPAVVTTGATTVVTGGCQVDGKVVSGRIVLENVPAPDDDVDRSAVARITFEGYGVGAELLDGTVERTGDGARLDVELTATLDDVTAITSLSLTCDERGLCAAGDGALVDVDGLGVLDVLGAWRNAPAAGGYLTLRGGAVMTLDLNALADGCAPYTLDGAAAGRLCGLASASQPRR